ncbi:MAG: AAA family ATPase [Phycisphaerales bacterium]|nr:AAA family ATPase [Hyphomonadaceae bacterium]
MIITDVTISGFRCFGPTPAKVALAPEVTALVGLNAAGKTAVLQALSKVFGVTRAERTVAKGDFHLTHGEPSDSTAARSLFIDVVVAFPELVSGKAKPETIAPSFRHMLISETGATPVCRVRLEASWEDDGTVEGAVTQNTYWIDTRDEPGDEDKHPMAGSDRGLIQLYYTPASRDAAAQVRAKTGALAGRLLRAIAWSEGVEEAVEEAGEKLGDAFSGEAAVAAIEAAVNKRWSALNISIVDTNPRLRLVSRRFQEIINKLAVVFESGPAQDERGLEALSEGQQSLFYFALAAAVFDLERDIVVGKAKGFAAEQLRIPALSVFAVEEPENHLSPFYLSRIVGELREMAKTGSAQVVLSSHAPGVLSRVSPDEVRYCRRDPKLRASSVTPISLPKDGTEAAKFVRGAMLAYPELYFARFVLLVEGDSERIVIPRIAAAMGLVLDPAFVAIVPLGGRHVEHFWRLLGALKIPYATLLDLDLGRTGGAYGRVKVALKHLIAAGWDKNELLALEGGGVLSDKSLEQMHSRAPDTHLEGWANSLQDYNVFFSQPLDIDLAMLAAFPAAYAAVVPSGGGPQSDRDSAAAAVLGKDGASTYEGGFQPLLDLLPEYRYHFLTRSKPATHIAALSQLDDAALKKNAPDVLKRVIQHIKDKLEGEEL